jgi:hypothetical protein
MFKGRIWIQYNTQWKISMNQSLKNGPINYKIKDVPMFAFFRFLSLIMCKFLKLLSKSFKLYSFKSFKNYIKKLWHHEMV